MVYSNRFVVAVLLNGIPQSELANGVVKLPFGSEYSLRLRNKNNRRAVAKIYVDGDNVSGGGYVIGANSYVDIKRHHDVDRAFKFVDLDSPDAVDFGKNGPNHDKVKGTIEVRFHLERAYYTQTPIVEEHHHHHHHYPRRKVWPNPSPIWFSATCSPSADMKCKGASSTDGGMRGLSYNSADAGPIMSAGCATSNYSAPAPSSEGIMHAASTAPELRDGCTVEGNLTGQSFYSTSVDYEEDFVALKVFLQGFDAPERVAEVPVAQPVRDKNRDKNRNKRRKTNKSRRLDELEADNIKLREKLAELENENLKKRLEEHTS